MAATDDDILHLGMRIESTHDAQLARWLVASAGTERVRRAAQALRARQPPRPLRVGHALGIDEATLRGAAPPTPATRPAQHDLRRLQGFRAP